MPKCDSMKIKYIKIKIENKHLEISVFILFKNGQSAAKPWIEEGSTTRAGMLVG